MNYEPACRKQNMNYELGIMNYELGIMNYELGIRNYECSPKALQPHCLTALQAYSLIP